MVGKTLLTDQSPSRTGLVGPFARLGRPGWMAPALLGGFPLWWALGLGELIFALITPLLLWDLVRHRAPEAPRSLALYAGFVIAVAASGLMLERPSALLGWAVRTAQYAGIGLLLPYCVTHRRHLAARHLLGSLVWLWVAAIGAGLAGLLLGPRSFPTPLLFILPDGITSNPFVAEQLRPGLADVDRFLGFTSVRPKAPFTYTNGWGAAVGLLFPVAALGAVRDLGVPQRLVRVSLVVAALPIIASLNRGLWLSLALGLLYGGSLVVRRHGSRAVVTLLLGAALTTAAVAVSPLGSLVEQRLRTGHSDADRAELYLQVIDELDASPVLGFGAPRPTDDGPPLGTHGQLWVVLFSHGLLGAVLYFGFFGAQLLDSLRGRSPEELTGHVILAIGAAQIFFYGHVPQQLAILMTVIAAIHLRRFELAAGTAEPREAGAT